MSDPNEPRDPDPGVTGRAVPPDDEHPALPVPASESPSTPPEPGARADTGGGPGQDDTGRGLGVPDGTDDAPGAEGHGSAVPGGAGGVPAGPDDQVRPVFQAPGSAGEQPPAWPGTDVAGSFPAGGDAYAGGRTGQYAAPGPGPQTGPHSGPQAGPASGPPGGPYAAPGGAPYGTPGAPYGGTYPGAYAGAPPRTGEPTQAFGAPGGPPPLPGQAVHGPPPGGPGWPSDGSHDPHGSGRGGGRGRFVGIVIVVAIVAALAGGTAGGYIGAQQAGPSSDFHLGSSPKGSTQRAPQSVAGVAQRVTPSVVDIKVSSAGSGDEGSGFLVEGGYIMTNNHVVSAAAKGGGDLRVNFNDGSRTSARIVGRDASYDIAVLKPDTTGGRKALPLGNSDGMVVGDPVIAVGSPLGLAGTVTTGIISAKDRPVTAGGEDGTQQSYINALQTDAAINPGNSGGPLVNAKGEVIGVNSAIAANPGSTPGQQSGSIGLGFAIPINKARQVAEQLIKTGKVRHPVIGALIDMGYAGDGARIAQNSGQGPGIVSGGPADKAGLKAGDVITKIDGKRIQNAEALLVDIKSHQVGQTISVTYRRGGTEHTVKVKLAAQ